MSEVFAQVLDAVDVETFLVCESEEEGKRLILKMLEDFGFHDVDTVYVHFQGPGVRVRARGYVHKPGDYYGWLDLKADEKKDAKPGYPVENSYHDGEVDQK